MGFYNQSSSTKRGQCSGEMSNISSMMTMPKPLNLFFLHA